MLLQQNWVQKRGRVEVTLGLKIFKANGEQDEEKSAYSFGRLFPKIIFISEMQREEPHVKKQADPFNYSSYQSTPSYNYQYPGWNYSSYPHYPYMPYYYPLSSYSYMQSPSFPLASNQLPERDLLEERKEGQEALRENVKVEEQQLVVPRRQEESLAEGEEKWGQKFGRNIMSNIFHMGLKKIVSKDFRPWVASAIKQHSMDIRIEQFRSKLEDKIKHVPGYINVRSMRRLLVGNPIGATRTEIDFRKLLRLLMALYLAYYHVPHIFFSGKIKKQSRALHLDAIRKLRQRLSRL